MNITITINTDNEAFVGQPKEEVRRILGELFKPGGGLLRTWDGRKLLDVNGNTVGKVEITD